VGPSCPDADVKALPEQLKGLVIHWPRTYQHPNARPFVEPIRQALARLAPLVRSAIDQPFAGLVICGLELRGLMHYMALDYYDFPHVNEAAAAKVEAYFKLQFRVEGYAARNVLPGGYVSGGSVLYRHWCRLRSLHNSRPPQADVFGRFGLRFSTDIRQRAIEILSADPRFTFSGGVRRTEQSRYLREMALARVCIDLPGQGPFCYRLVEAMAMGCCVVGPPHAARLPVPLQNGVEIAYCAPDLSDLRDVCWRYVSDEQARRAVGSRAAAYFDRHLHPIRLAERYLVETARLIGAGPAS